MERASHWSTVRGGPRPHGAMGPVCPFRLVALGRATGTSWTTLLAARVLRARARAQRSAQGAKRVPTCSLFPAPSISCAGSGTLPISSRFRLVPIDLIPGPIDLDHDAVGLTP